MGAVRRAPVLVVAFLAAGGLHAVVGGTDGAAVDTVVGTAALGGTVGGIVSIITIGGARGTGGAGTCKERGEGYDTGGGGCLGEGGERVR